MEFRVDKATFLQGLYYAQGIADRKATMPILANVLLKATTDNQLVIAATDLNLTAITEVACETAQPGGITVSAKHLYDLVKSLPSDSVHFKKLDNQYAELRAGKTKYKLVALADADFPKLPEAKQVKFAMLDAAVLRDLVSKTFFAISSDETRYHLNGVLLESEEDGAIRMVATDGHRLAKCEHNVQGFVKMMPGVLIPRRGVTELRRALEGASHIELGVHMGHLFVRNGGTTLSIKLLDAQFPPYVQVIPKAHQKTAVVGATALLESLRRILLVSSDRTFGVKMSLTKDTLRLEADNPDLGQGLEEIPITCEGGDLVIGFNAKYLIEALAEADTMRVQLELSGELDPGLLRLVDESGNGLNRYLSVVMPMRI